MPPPASPYHRAKHRALRALPIEQPPRILVDRSGLVTHRRIRPARTTRMLTLPTLSALLKILKAKGAGRTPVSALRTHRRDPVVLAPAMLALAADRHTSRLYQKLPTRATATTSCAPQRQNQRAHDQSTPRLLAAPRPHDQHPLRSSMVRPATKRQFAAQPRALPVSAPPKSVSRPASNPIVPGIQFPWGLPPPHFSICVSRDTVTFLSGVCLHSLASPASRSPSSSQKPVLTAAATSSRAAARARRSLRSFSSGAAPHASACSRLAPRSACLERQERRG
jgi:hypothetical protein